MEFANKAVNFAARAANNNTVINVCLLTSFTVLGIRSMNQQREIEALEAEKDSLLKRNKATKNAMWDWKQKLYAEASKDDSLVPLAKIKAIYGDVTTSPVINATTGEASSGNGKPPKIVI